MINDKLGVGIIGCGLIGNKRAKVLGKNAKLLACADINIKNSTDLAAQYNAKYFSKWEDLLLIKEIDIVIISTLHDSLSKIGIEAIKAKKHVLVEKPAAKNSKELIKFINSIKGKKQKVHVGFNHRFHRAIIKAKQLVDKGAIGDLMFLRARYGHGGRVGYDKEWRANPKISGGGELIDQGPHLIDLSRLFLGEFTDVSGFACTYFWDMPVDDNAFLTLKTSDKKTAFLHVSCTEWKNIFSMEIYGKKGKIDISGLGGSYGLEKITFYKMSKKMGPPETFSWEFPMEDNSWELEFEEFCNEIKNNKLPASNLNDALEAMKIIEKIYKDSK
jgi:predicted dehydrogenase